MKKIIALALAAVMALSMVACGGETAPEVATYKVGMGVFVEETATDATADKDGQQQINTTVALITLDAEGKIVKADIDVAQQTSKVNAEGVIAATDDMRTKMEKGPDYGMKADWGSQIGEWDEQVSAFENWMVGKTVAEVTGMEFTTNSHDYPDTPADADLKATTTISMTAFIKAVEKAAANAVEVKGAAKVGLGSDIEITASNATADKDGSVQVSSTWAGIAVDEAGKIVWSAIDVAQQTTKFSAAGAVTGNADLRTKREKGPDYGMKADWGSQIGEWDEQIAGFEAWMMGKTVAEVTGMEFTTNSHDYPDTPADADLKATTTISMTAFLNAIAEADTNAK